MYYFITESINNLKDLGIHEDIISLGIVLLMILLTFAVMYLISDLKKCIKTKIKENIKNDNLKKKTIQSEKIIVFRPQNKQNTINIYSSKLEFYKKLNIPDENVFIQELVKRKIVYFVHFTKINNLKSILRKGIQPRDNLKDYRCNSDDNRYDKRTDCVSLSVEFPNYRYFYKARMNNDEKYCILLLNAYKIFKNEDIEKFFLETNAANHRMLNAMKYEDLTTINAFKSMFWWDDDWQTADVQAEILYKGIIAPNNIEYVVFENNKTIPAFIKELDVKYYVNDMFFQSRNKYKRKIA